MLAALLLNGQRKVLLSIIFGNIRWWSLITGVRLIQAGNTRNDRPFQVLFRSPRPRNRGVCLIKISFKVN